MFCPPPLSTRSYPPFPYTTLFRSVSLHFPHLSLLFQKLYVPKSPLWLSTSSLAERECILSEEGVQQGDPLGPFLFSMGLQPALEQAQQALDDMQRSEEHTSELQ